MQFFANLYHYAAGRRMQHTMMAGAETLSVLCGLDEPLLPS